MPYRKHSGYEDGYFNPPAQLHFELDFHDREMKEDLHGDREEQEVAEFAAGRFDEAEEEAIEHLERILGADVHSAGGHNTFDAWTGYVSVADRQEMTRLLNRISSASGGPDGRIYCGPGTYFEATSWHVEVPGEGTFDVFGTSPVSGESIYTLLDRTAKRSCRKCGRNI